MHSTTLQCGHCCHSICQHEDFCAQLCALKLSSLGLFYTEADSIPQQPISWQSTSGYCVLLVWAATVQLCKTVLHTELPTSSPSSPYIHSPKWSPEAPEGLQGWRNCRIVVDGSVLLSFSAFRWQHLGLGLLAKAWTRVFMGEVVWGFHMQFYISRLPNRCFPLLSHRPTLASVWKAFLNIWIFFLQLHGLGFSFPPEKNQAVNS